MMANVDYEKLNAILAERGISRRKLAEKIGESPNTLVSSFNRKSDLKLPIIVKISEVLNVSPDEITGVNDMMDQYQKNEVYKIILSYLQGLNTQGRQFVFNAAKLAFETDAFRQKHTKRKEESHD